MSNPSVLEANAAVERWLAGAEEEPALEPGLPIVDPHHHLWDLRTFTMEPHASFEQKVYLCEEMMRDVSTCGHNIEQTVFAQCGAFYRADGPEPLRCVGETEFAHGIAAMSRSGVYGSVRLCAGIFGTADLRRGRAADEVLRAHLNASENFRGIRSAFPANLDDGFLEGFACLGARQLSFDNYSPDHRRLPTLRKLADRFPEVTVIVNHLGGKVEAGAAAHAFAAWRADIEEIARSPNAVMKLGGAQQRVGAWEPPFHMHQASAPLSSEALCELLLPYYRAALEAFGPERCMFESNFPVDKECASYGTLWNAFKRMAAAMGLSAGEKTAVFSATARRCYRLDPIAA
jgi:predicted TIM-barrel fold metal-dependent hydrolase